MMAVIHHKGVHPSMPFMGVERPFMVSQEIRMKKFSAQRQNQSFETNTLLDQLIII